MTNPIEVYENISYSQLSIARYYGGLTVNGSSYIYDPRTDQLIRSDVFKHRQRDEKESKKTARKSLKKDQEERQVSLL